MVRQGHQSVENLKAADRQQDAIGFWLTVLMLCLLPIERLVFPMGLKVADFALVLVTAYGLGKAWRTGQRLSFPLLVPMWLILLSSLVATLLGIAPSESILAIAQEVYLFAWFLVLTNLLLTFSSGDLDRLTKIWSLVALLEAGTTLLGLLRIGPALFYTSPLAEVSSGGGAATAAGFSRSVGTFVNPNAAAAYLSVSFFVLLATSWPVWLRATLGAWLLAGMFGTGSMGALFSTLGALGVLLVIHAIIKDRRAVMLWGAVLSIGGSLVAAASFALGIASSSSEFAFDTGARWLALTLGRLPRSIASRLNALEQAWSVYSRHPWGTGPNSSHTILLSLHNDYVAFLFERGPIGAIGWLWIVVAALLTPLRAAIRSVDDHHRWRLLALGAGFAASALNAFSHEISHFRQVWVLMAFIFAASGLHATRAVKDDAAGAPMVDGTQGKSLRALRPL